MVSNDMKFMIKRPGLVLNTAKNLREYLAERTVLNEVFINQSYYWLFSRLRPGTVLIDIGAFIGDTAIYFAQSDKVKHVIAFELSGKNFGRAKQNIAFGPFAKKIKVFNFGVGATSGTVDISDTGMPTTTARGKRRSARVQMKTLNEITRSAGSNRIAVKCDVEGGEVSILRDADLRGVYALQIEYHETRRELVRLLTEKGFKTTVLEAHEGVLYKDVGYVCAQR